MEAGTTSAYRHRKRPLNGRPCNPKVKRRLFPADAPRPDRRAAEMERLLLKRQGLVDAVDDTWRLLQDIGLYGYRELEPLYCSIINLESAIRACKDGTEVPAEVHPDPSDDDNDEDYDGYLTSSSPPPSLVEHGAALVAVVTRGGDDAVRGKRRAKANTKYYGPEWAKK